MRNIIQQLVASGSSLGLGGIKRFYIDDRRKQRNIERVMADPEMTKAALAGVIADHRVVETIVKADDMARNIILQLEAKLGRKLGRERAQKLLTQYNLARAARLRQSFVVLKNEQAPIRMAA